MKVRVFKWNLDCRTATPNDFYDFESDFRDIVCPYLLTMVDADAMNDYNLVDKFIEFNPEGDVELIIKVPLDGYKQSEFQKVVEELESLIDDTFGHWEFESEEVLEGIEKE